MVMDRPHVTDTGRYMLVTLLFEAVASQNKILTAFPMLLEAKPGVEVLVQKKVKALKEAAESSPHAERVANSHMLVLICVKNYHTIAAAEFPR